METIIEGKSQKVWDFQKQLKLGTQGEELFIQYYHEPLIIYPKRRADFKTIKEGLLVELKSDSYNMEKTPYFFMERWSDFHKKKPGGPWQSRSKRVDRFCYYFVKHDCYFEFKDIRKLTDKLDELTSKQGLVFVKNKGWVSAGYKVKRDDLKELYTCHRFEVKGE